MISIADIQDPKTLDDYAASVPLRRAVEELSEATAEHVEHLQGRTVWMLNSTEKGGGVAEMMPKLVTLLRELGVETEWIVMGSDDGRFFPFTKQIHNMLHGEGKPPVPEDGQAVYEAVSRRVADALEDRVSEDDLLVVHDPQPLGAGALLHERTGVPAIWRCHIGVDESTPGTRAAWEFLRPWAEQYDESVFTVREYVPDFLEENAAIIPPSIDPLSDKNRELPVRKIAGILSNAQLTDDEHQVVPPPFEAPAKRLQPDGVFAPATEPEDIGLLFRPIVTQVSRWDRLKGWRPLLEGFARLKRRRHDRSGLSDEHRRRLDLVRLVLAGPDPSSIQDDPEALGVFEDLCAAWHGLDDDVQKDVALLVLPMDSRRINALMVNAIQRCSTIVTQNSLREGFGLTVTEAMWKRLPVLGTHAVGIREQVTDDVEGRLLSDPEDSDEIARVLDEMLEDNTRRTLWAHNAQLRVAERYLVFAQAQRWLDVLGALVERPVAVNGEWSPA